MAAHVVRFADFAARMSSVISDFVMKKKGGRKTPGVEQRECHNACAPTSGRSRSFRGAKVPRSADENVHVAVDSADANVADRALRGAAHRAMCSRTRHDTSRRGPGSNAPLNAPPDQNKRPRTRNRCPGDKSSREGDLRTARCAPNERSRHPRQSRSSVLLRRGCARSARWS
jgi:hypothetical protein